MRSARRATRGCSRLVPGHERTDLRNPAQVKELLASVGVVVPNTRKWVLEPFRDTHPVVAALLEWRKAERIATTYGYPWLDTHVGPDDRLRGGWTACDGAAGRMTAQNGLHNLPAEMRSAVAAQPGHVFVRADLGQIEPRVLAVVSGDEAFAAATRADDLYAPVAARLGVDRPVAKVAVLAAMYGQRSGAAGEALKGLERAYPVAMAYLDRAYAAGLRREPAAHLRRAADPPRRDPGRRAGGGRGGIRRGARTVRAQRGDPGLGGRAVQGVGRHRPRHHARSRRPDRAVPARRAARARAGRARRGDPPPARCVALDDSARRWSGTTAVRFVADASVIHRWSEAKD